MSTKSIRELLARASDAGLHINDAEAEFEAIKRAAKDLTRLHLGDFTDAIAHRDAVVSAMTTPESQWEHSDVKAWSEASTLLEQVAKDAT